MALIRNTRNKNLQREEANGGRLLREDFEPAFELCTEILVGCSGYIRYNFE
jgi:hypothetical protein